MWKDVRRSSEEITNPKKKTSNGCESHQKTKQKTQGAGRYLPHIIGIYFMFFFFEMFFCLNVAFLYSIFFAAIGVRCDQSSGNSSRKSLHLEGMKDDPMCFRPFIGAP